jgi:hypothetical protein
MDKRQCHHRSHLFTVRVWKEDLGNQAEWRGKVQCVTDGQAHYFRDWSALAGLLQEMLADRETARCSTDTAQAAGLDDGSTMSA